MIYTLYYAIYLLLYIIFNILFAYYIIYHSNIILFSIIITIYNTNRSLLLLNELSQLRIYRLKFSTTKLLHEPNIIVLKLETMNRRMVYWEHRSENLHAKICKSESYQQLFSPQGNCLLNRNLLQSNMRIRELQRTDFLEPR